MVKSIFSGVLKISFDCHLELLHYNYNNDINTHVSNGPTSDGTHNSDLFHSWNRGIVPFPEQGYWCLLFGINGRVKCLQTPSASSM